MRSAHRVVSPKELFIEIRGEPPEPDQDARRIVRYHIHELRKKLAADRASPYYVRTVYGHGYTLGAGHPKAIDPGDGGNQVTGRRFPE
jgi:DNA-binding response OmpR family regulator